MSPAYYALGDDLTVALTKATAFLNGAFGLALLTAIFGSFFGAYGAQWIAERENTKRRTFEQVRATNAAISLAIFTVNALIATRRQHLIERLKSFRAKHAEFLLMREQAQRSASPLTFEYTANWETLPWTEVPVAELKAILFDKIDNPRAITLINMLAGTVNHLRDTMARLNDIADEMRNGTGRSDNDVAHTYFGVRMPNGRQDSRNRDSLNAAEAYNENAILFGTVLINVLIEHGGAVAKTLRVGAPRIVQADFGSAIDEGLVASPLDYAEVLGRMGIDPQSALRSLRPLTGKPKPKAASPTSTLLTKLRAFVVRGRSV
jgi:hypothetical protein